MLWERSGGVGLRPGEGDANHPARPKPGSCPAQHGARHPPSLLHPPMPLLAAPGPVSPPTAACQAPSCPHRATEPPFHVSILQMLEPGTSSAIPELRLPPCPPPPGPGHPTARSAPTSPRSCCRCSWPALRVLLLLPISSSIFLISILAATSLVLLSVACLELPQPGEAPGWVRDTGAGGLGGAVSPSCRPHQGPGRTSWSSVAQRFSSPGAGASVPAGSTSSTALTAAAT